MNRKEHKPNFDRVLHRDLMWDRSGTGYWLAPLPGKLMGEGS